MADLKTRGDSLYEYLTGAGSDGGTQLSPSLSFGNFRSATEAIHYGIFLTNAIRNAKPVFASGLNPSGAGQLTAFNTTDLAWTPNGASGYGPRVTFTGTETKMLEAINAPGQYLRVAGTVPFAPGVAIVSLVRKVNSVFASDDVSIAESAAGVNKYRGTIVRNESSNAVNTIQRYVATYGTQQVSNSAQLGGSGSGTIATSGSFASWPTTGWCQVRSSGNTLKEVVYYSARTATVLTVPTAGRALLGTSATAGANTDKVYAVPGIAIALEPGGTQAFGNAIQIIVNGNTAPSGVTWNKEITAATGLQLATLAPNFQIGFWIWKHVPAGIKATPLQANDIYTNFLAS